MGHPESFLALESVPLLRNFVTEHDLGFCTGADDLIELMPKLVRGPDVCFVAWKKRPDRTVDTDPISKCIPDLVVEVLSPKNTRGEMARKRKSISLRRLGRVGYRPPERTAEVYTAPDSKIAIPPDGVLEGGDVLPGFKLPLAKLFAKFPAPPSKKPNRKKK